MLKLKRKLQFRGHVYFEAVRPAFLEAALTWLKNNNKLYKDIMIECGNVSSDLTELAQINSNDATAESTQNTNSLNEDDSVNNSSEQPEQNDVSNNKSTNQKKMVMMKNRMIH